MEQLANQNSTTISVFSDYISNPAKISATDTAQLASLLRDFPYCQILHAFASRAVALDEKGGELSQSLTKAALYSSNRNILYTVMHHPEALSQARDIAGNQSSQKMLVVHPEVEVLVTEEEIIPSSLEFQMSSSDVTIEALSVEEVLAKEESIAQEHLGALDESRIVHEVSKYDDDTMPYSFLWWLNQTREAYVYQPYAQSNTTVSAKNNAVDGLNHQIVEHIFHQQLPPLKVLERGVNKLTFKRTEEAILDKFIQDDPQIKPPQSGNLSAENKARQSAQDLNDLVSETLAGIYTRQMLLDKAIDTYKKLSLKLPEKSAYFADLIHALEEKLNK
ncbi:MAG: hypothetical protein U0X71_07145 [Sphingobacteriaceae bacterium]|nr:MAG: hypothetical protein E6Q66_05460 [Pedobacter sp.]